MAREGVDLYGNVDFSDPAQLQQFLRQLRVDFDSHNHDGVNSRAFETLIAQTIVGRTAIISGYRLFEGTVGPNSADFKTVAEALLAGKKRIFVKNGTYSNEPTWNITNPNTIIIGESFGGVVVSFAQDVANSRSIYVNATRAVFQNLSLTSYEAGQQDLFQFGASGSYPQVSNCVLRNYRGKIFNGASLSNLFGTFSNIYVDCLSTNDATLMKVFDTINNSFVSNVIVDMNFASSGFVPINSCANTYFLGCQFKMDASRSNEYSISGSSTCFFSACYFFGYQIAPNANCDGCFFENNGNSAASYFVSITTAVMRFNNNRVKCAAADNIFNIVAANVQANNNLFDGGKQMVFEPSGASILGIMFCNNQWISSYATAAMDLRLGSIGHVTDNANIAYNVIRNNSNSFTPTITNNSANCNVTGNQLIKG